MAFMSMRNLRFTLQDKLAATDGAAAFNGHDAKSMDMVLAAAHDLARNEMLPMFEDMDRHPPELVNGAVRVHPGVRNLMTTLGRDGWISAVFPERWGGEDMPATLLHCINFIFASANYSASVFHGLTAGAARLILNFGSEALQETFLPPMLEGRWQGTMALTEPEAGSSLGDLVTRARPLAGDQYRISGEKIFISAGDHDGVDNVVHLMLARIDGAPAGSRGISLFVVPKYRPEPDGSLTDNDVVVTQVFHKLGYRGAPITGLRMGEKGDCIGYLVGEAHQGLPYMFQMMNGARLEVGTGATAIATAAYHAALGYARSRKQGRPVAGPKDGPQVPLLSHPDVRRMLLFQRAVSEGALALIIQCGIYEDLFHRDPDANRDAGLLLELLTPVAKTYPSEMGILSTSAAIQCFGGYGYCDDFPVEQYFRDMRIHPIHEGTTGIQAMDLLGRKLLMENGRALGLLKQEMETCMTAARDHDGLGELADSLSEAVETVETTTLHLGGVAAGQGPEAYLADATLYLELFGHVTIAWQWLAMAVTAADRLSGKKVSSGEKRFLDGKIHVARYFFSHELPKIRGLAATLALPSSTTLAVPEACFTN